MKRYFHSELASLRSQLTIMGKKAITATEAAVRSLNTNQIELAETVIDGDVEIDQLEIEIDHEAIRYLTLRAPVAIDLRFLTVAIKASHDLERVGDEAKGIAKKCRRILRRNGNASETFYIPEMATQSIEMLTEAVDAFINGDANLAKRILEKDKVVDQLNKQNLKALVKTSKADPEGIETFIDLMFISKALERIADHATNLAEEIIFMETAQEARHNSLDADKSD